MKLLKVSDRYDKTPVTGTVNAVVSEACWENLGFYIDTHCGFKV